MRGVHKTVNGRGEFHGGELKIGWPRLSCAIGIAKMKMKRNFNIWVQYRLTWIANKFANQQTIPNQPMQKHFKKNEFGKLKMQRVNWAIACQWLAFRIWMAPVALHN